jgi:hypothetical protein
VQGLLNTPGSLPEEVEGDILVQDLHLGNKAPEIRLLAIREFGMEQGFVFDLFFAFNPPTFNVTFKTKAQINPLYSKAVKKPDVDARPFTVPITIGIDQLAVEAKVRISIHPEQGAFIEWLGEDGPSVEFRVFSSFDDVAVIRNHLQSAIELKVREALQVDLPALVREYSAALLGGQKLQEQENATGMVGKKENLLLNASYSTPYGLFVVENGMFSKFSIPKEYSPKEEAEELAPIVISFPVRSKVYHFLTTSSLFLKDNNLLASAPLSSKAKGLR